MEELVTKAKKGDKEAFTKLVLLISNDLYKIAKTRIPNDDDIDDIIQDTMLDAYKDLKKLKELAKFKKWIIKILVNKCNKFYKQKYKNNEVKSIDIEYCDIENRINDFKKIESQVDFYSIIKFLNYEERIVLVLYYLEKYKVKEIRAITKMNENTINIHLSRARKK